jgi:hypothetical protein
MPTRARHAAPVALAALLVAACGRGDGARPDTALARDLTLASSAARPPLDASPTLGDTAAARPEPAPLPPPAAAAPAASRAEAEAPRPVAPRPAAPRPARAAVREASDAPAAAPVRRAPEGPARSATTADAAPAPAAADAPAAAGAGAGRAIAAGTLLTGSLGQRVCTESNRPGDRFVATLGSDVTGPGGAALPAGTPIVLELSRATGDPPSVEFVVRGVSVAGEFVAVAADALPVTGSVERRQVVDKESSAKGKAVQGAIAGAILGRVLGGGRSTVIGAAGGAAAGAAMGRGRSHEEACITPGAEVRVRLSEALAVR